MQEIKSWLIPTRKAKEIANEEDISKGKKSKPEYFSIVPNISVGYFILIAIANLTTTRAFLLVR